MLHKRSRIVVAVLVLAFTLTALIGSVRAAELLRIEPPAEPYVAPLDGEFGSFWIMGGCEGSAGGCPWD
jgi:hypothetical protein